MESHLNENNLITESKHGFRNGKSITTNLIESVDIITKSLNNNEFVDAIYLDFEKAFDTVPHYRLVTKLKAYGISGKLLNWIESFLLNRQQRVSHNNYTSDWREVLSGVPQGSVLGPLLFTIYINDMPELAVTPIKLFADDTKLFGKSTSSQDTQYDLNKLASWSDSWLQRFNFNKCEVLHIGNFVLCSRKAA